MDVWQLERLYSRALSREYADYTHNSIKKATQSLTLEELELAIAGLKLPWYREACERVWYERLARRDPWLAIRGIIAAERVEEKDDRLIRLMRNVFD